jgi:hypothetical protein
VTSKGVTQPALLCQASQFVLQPEAVHCTAWQSPLDSSDVAGVHAAPYKTRGTFKYFQFGGIVTPTMVWLPEGCVIADLEEWPACPGLPGSDLHWATSVGLSPGLVPSTKSSLSMPVQMNVQRKRCCAAPFISYGWILNHYHVVFRV